MPALGLKPRVTAFLLLVFCWHGLAAQQVKVKNFYSPEGNGFRWRVYIDEDASVLQQISCVEYRLYPSFSNPVREVCTPWDHFVLEERGQREFTMVVKIEWHNREPTLQPYTLDLHSSRTLNSTKDPLLRNVQPVGLALLRSGDLVIADGYTKHILLATPTGVRQIEDVSPHSPVTVSSLQLDDREVILVATNWEGSPRPGGVWMFPATGGGRIDYWNDSSSSLLIGTARDDSGKALYVTDDSPDLFRIRVNGGRLVPSGIGVRVGDQNPDLLIAVDPKGSSLFLADKKTGHFYRIDLPNGRAHSLNLNGSIGNLSQSPFLQTAKDCIRLIMETLSD